MVARSRNGQPSSKGQLDFTSTNASRGGLFHFKLFTPPFGFFGVKGTVSGSEWLFPCRTFIFTGLCTFFLQVCDDPVSGLFINQSVSFVFLAATPRTVELDKANIPKKKITWTLVTMVKPIHSRTHCFFSFSLSLSSTAHAIFSDPPCTDMSHWILIVI